MSTVFPYDVVPYQGNFQQQLHPDRLAAPARLLGMLPAAVNSCRYLELGCGEGENLINSAFALPGSKFIGVDLSARHIEAAKKAAKELNLKNVEFLQFDVMQMSRERFGQFDYIAAHGLFSWVAEPVRRKILALYDELLAPHGVGHISFNALPGGYLRQMMRDMVLYHTRKTPPSLAKEEKSTIFLDILQTGTEKNEYYKTILRHETENLSNRKPGGILHDELSGENQPFYFHEFVALAEANNLQYLCDSEYFSLPLNIFPPPTAEFLASCGDDIIEREQYADFLLCRRFRNLLLCRSDVSLNRSVESKKLGEFYVAGNLNSIDENPKLETNEVVKFTAPNINGFELDYPLAKIAAIRLGETWTDSVKFDDLMNLSRERLETSGYIVEDWENTRQITERIFLELYKNSAVELRTYQADLVREASDLPRISQLTRRQLRTSNIITTVNNNELELSSSFMRALLLLLDGTRDRLALTKELRKCIRGNEFADFKKKTTLLRELPTLLEESLAKIAKAGLLIS